MKSTDQNKNVIVIEKGALLPEFVAEFGEESVDIARSEIVEFIEECTMLLELFPCDYYDIYWDLINKWALPNATPRVLLFGLNGTH